MANSLVNENFASQRDYWRISLACCGIGSAILLLLVGNLEPTKPEVTRTAAVAILMATLWITEAIPLAVTSLIPLAAIPLLGIQDGEEVAKQYIGSTIFLYIGGFIVALAMERWNLHRRIALRILVLVGSSPARLILGFMLATATLSMFISNTATAMMMVTIAMALIATLDAQATGVKRNSMAIGLLLAVAYASSIGGVATLVGTPTNLSFVRIYEISFPDRPPVSFVQWMCFATPMAAVLLLIAWASIVWFWCQGQSRVLTDGELQELYRQLGPWTWPQRVVLAVFLSLVLLWITRSDVQIGATTLKGWESLFPHPEYFNDGAVAIAASLVLFLIPSRQKPNERIIDESAIKKLPWDIVLLFGGGFALAAAFTKSGLSVWLGNQLSGLSQLHTIVVIVSVCLLLSLLTELTSNVATAEMILPILAALSTTLGIDPLMLMVPATITCSFAFMLPVATPPNAIVFGTNQLRVVDMVKTGFVVNMLAVVLIVLFIRFWGPVCFGFQFSR